MSRCVYGCALTATRLRYRMLLSLSVHEGSWEPGHWASLLPRCFIRVIQLYQLQLSASDFKLQPGAVVGDMPGSRELSGTLNGKSVSFAFNESSFVVGGQSTLTDILVISTRFNLSKQNPSMRQHRTTFFGQNMPARHLNYTSW